ncbi:sensor histidine kinase [Roseivirga sp.]|uniref:sensor histidine kinase n=1 Tax=Roseivirga sp. TaxID=1964215 RepID=UPI003B8C3763
MQTAKNWLEKNYRIVVISFIHVLAWVLYLGFYATAFIQRGDNLDYRIIFVLSVILTDVPVFYYSYLSTIPKLLVGQKVWKFLLITLAILILYPLSRYGIDLLFIKYYDGELAPLTIISTSQFTTVFGVRALAALFVIAMAGIGKFTFDWFENARIRRELENQNLLSELAFLKSQINPHFLFNTLNNIHTLAYKKAEGAPEAIMKLSELMRYMIYESDMSFVPLSKEIQHLKSFIDLQELRFKQKGIVNLEVTGDVKQREIAPLLLLPFIENAFKHGYDLNKEGAIKATLHIGDEIAYEVENLIPSTDTLLQKDVVGGIGLENVRRRLELIYPKSHTFLVNESSNSFTVRLTLKTHE